MRGGNQEQMDIPLLTVPETNEKSEEQSLLAEIESAYQKAQYSLARQSCEKILSTNRFHAEAKHYLGKIAIKQKDYIKAAGYFESINILPYAQKNQFFNYDCDTLVRCILDEINEIQGNIERDPQNTVEACHAVQKSLEKVGQLIAVAIKLKGTINDSVFVTQATQSQKNHLKSAQVIYTALSNQMPKIMHANIPAMTEDELVAHLTTVRTLHGQTIEFFLDERKIAEPESQKHQAVLAYQTTLESSINQAEVELTYKMCLRESSAIPAVGRILPAATRLSLLRLERLVKSLKGQAAIHPNSEDLLNDVNRRVAEIKTKILEKNQEIFISRSYQESVRYFQVPEMEQQKINEVLRQAVNHEPISNAIIYAEADDLESQAQSVGQLLTHYYSHTKFLGCCVTNKLELEEDFESKFENELNNAYQPPKIT